MRRGGVHNRLTDNSRLNLFYSEEPPALSEDGRGGCFSPAAKPPAERQRKPGECISSTPQLYSCVRQRRGSKESSKHLPETCPRISRHVKTDQKPTPLLPLWKFLNVTIRHASAGKTGKAPVWSPAYGRLGLLRPASGAFLSRFGGRKLRLAGGENGPVSFFEEVDPLAGKNSVRSRVPGFVHLREQIEHLLRPPLGLVLEGRPKFPKEMRSAQSIPTHPSDAGRLRADRIRTPGRSRASSSSLLRRKDASRGRERPCISEEPRDRRYPPCRAV